MRPSRKHEESSPLSTRLVENFLKIVNDSKNAMEEFDADKGVPSNANDICLLLGLYISSDTE